MFLNRLKGLTESFPEVSELDIGQISVVFALHLVECSKQELKIAIWFYYEMINNKYHFCFCTQNTGQAFYYLFSIAI